MLPLDLSPEMSPCVRTASCEAEPAILCRFITAFRDLFFFFLNFAS